MNRKSNTKKLAINALLLAVGALLHAITPALGLPMQPDFALAMLFIIMILNDGEFKTSMIAGIITGVFTALTTKFPGGQLPNIIDKVITVIVVCGIMYLLNKIKSSIDLKETLKNNIMAAIILPVGTLVSGTAFLASAGLIVGLPGGASFGVLFVGVVLPAVAINLVAGIFLLNIVKVSLKRVSAYN